MLKRLFNLLLPPSTPEAFTKEAVAFVTNLGGNVTVEVTAPLSLKVTRGNDDPQEVNLDNAYLTYLNNRFSRKNIIAHFTLSLLETDASETVLPKNVIPTIKDKDYLDEVRTQLVKKGSNPDEFFVSEPYNEELVIVYAVDSPRSIRYLNPTDLAELNLNGENLREFALRNLKDIMPPVEVHGTPPFFQLKAGGMFESALLLFDRIWEKKELEIAGDIIVAVPSRETLLVADGNSPAAVEQLQKSAQKLSANAAYRLTPKLFKRVESRFEVLN